MTPQGETAAALRPSLIGPARGPWTNLGRLPLGVFSVGKYAFQKKFDWARRCFKGL